jgi:hypothetical protein
MIDNRTVEFVNGLCDVLYRFGLALNAGVAVGFAWDGDYRQSVAALAMIGMLVCTIRLRDAGSVWIDRWRDRKLAEYHPEDDGDGR